MAVSLVTGGAGFIGSHLVEHLVEKGHRVRVVDDLSTGHLWRLDRIRDRIDLIQADLSTAPLDPIVADAERVFHLAAVPSVSRSVRDPLLSHGSIATATLRLLAALKESGATIVISSSSSVYGETAASPKSEDLPTRPISPYAVAKLAAEGYGRVFSELFGLRVVMLRYFNVFGPRQDPDSPYAAVIPIFIRRALRGEPLPIHGDGGQTRDFTYVENVVEANMSAAAARLDGPRVYNIAAGSPQSLLDLVRALETILGRDLEVHHGPPRTGDIRHSAADITRAALELGWRPRIGFLEGLRRTAEWYRER